MNYNFVLTVPIFKIQNSAESYCLAELQYSSQNSLILPLFSPPPGHTKSNFIHQQSQFYFPVATGLYTAPYCNLYQMLDVLNK